ncbi:hypothetical protein JTB14_025862 [Gonioctena quinquepunctata]|nr:hypothetical protein JTB14_025862 [Gonioctena quinquepunctata]
MNEYEDDFKKIYIFKTSDLCTLPNTVFDSPKWAIPELQNKKHELNKVKGKLSKYKLKVWTKHTANRDRAGFVMKKLAESIKPELLTQAWCKFYEILGQFPIVPLCAISNHKLESLHLCEAPGAFVCALNHYLTLNYPGLEWAWIANTLNPHYEGNDLSQMIPDDRFIKHTLRNWDFGADFSGDLTKFHNHMHLVNNCRSNDSKISLVTADGSIDCMKDPGEQERHVERLHFCETITALSVLQTGGAFVLKIFTMFEESTINLLFLLNSLFEKVAVFKPCTSKSGNSEVYVVCTKFKGFASLQNIWSKMLIAYQDENLFSSNSMFCLDEIPQHFLDEISKCGHFFMQKQTRTILANIHHFENKTHEDVYVTKSFIAHMYLNKYELKPIPAGKKIVKIVNVGEDWTVHSTNRPKGIYRINLDMLMGSYKLSDTLHIEIGKQIATVHNSKFTFAENLKKIPQMFGKARTAAELYQRVLSLIRSRNVVINVGDFDGSSFHVFQREFFQKIYSSLGQNKNLILLNIPFVTHFLVGLLYILLFMYKEIHFGTHIIILYGPKLDMFHKVKEIFSAIQSKYQAVDEQNLELKGDFRDIVQVISPLLLRGTLVENVWHHNNRIFCENQCYSRPFGQIQLKTT